MTEHRNEEWQKSAQESRVVKCYFWETARKRACSVLSFSKSFLRGHKQEYSASCHRPDASKIPAVFYQTSVMHAPTTVRAGCSSAGASKKPCLLSPAHLGMPRVSLERGPRQAPCLSPAVWDHSLADTLQTSVWCWSSLLEEPLDLFQSLLWLPVSTSPSSCPGWFHTSVITREPREGAFELGRWR